MLAHSSDITLQNTTVEALAASMTLLTTLRAATVGSKTEDRDLCLLRTDVFNGSLWTAFSLTGADSLRLQRFYGEGAPVLPKDHCLHILVSDRGLSLWRFLTAGSYLFNPLQICSVVSNCNIGVIGLDALMQPTRLSLWKGHWDVTKGQLLVWQIRLLLARWTMVELWTGYPTPGSMT